MAKRKPASEMVIDQAPPADRSAPDPVERTEAAQKAIVPWATGGTLQIEFHPTMAEIAKMKEEALALLEENTEVGLIIKTKEGYDAIWKRYRELVPLRTAVDERRLEEGRQAREYVKMVNMAGNTIMEAIAAIEKPLKAAVDATDRKKEEEALAKALEIEAEQRRAEDARLAAIKAEEDARKAAEQAELQAAREKLLADRKRLDEERAELDRKQAAERAEQQKKIDEEMAKLAEARKNFERQQAELRAEQDKVRLENERQQREAQAKLDAERRAQETKAAEDRRQKELEEARKRAAEEALAAAERKRVADEKAAQEKKEREDREAAEKAAKAPDKKKFELIEAMLLALEFPEMKTKWGKDGMVKINNLVGEAMNLAQRLSEGGH